MMTVRQLIEELEKMPVKDVPARVTTSSWNSREIDAVTWEGNHVLIDGSVA